MKQEEYIHIPVKWILIWLGVLATLFITGCLLMNKRAKSLNYLSYDKQLHTMTQLSLSKDDYVLKFKMSTIIGVENQKINIGKSQLDINSKQVDCEHFKIAIGNESLLSLGIPGEFGGTMFYLESNQNNF